MAGKNVVGTIQLGDNATATQNFVLRTNNNGTLTLARGNDGVTTQDILTVDALGVVTLTNGMPKVPAFSATLTGAAVAIPATTFTNMPTDTVEYNTTSSYNNTTKRFTPSVAGIYAVSSNVNFNPGSTLPTLFKNGVLHSYGSYTTLTTGCYAGQIYLNGTTDYIEMRGYCSVSSQWQTGGTNRWAAYLVQKI